MKILLTGGTGFIGRALKKELIFSGHELFILTRSKRESTEGLSYIQWNPQEPSDLTELISKVDIVVNLAGEGIARKRWTKEQKEILLKSRITPTKAIADAINSSTKKPKKLITSSAIGIYGNRAGEETTESSQIGSDFLANLCSKWEAEAKAAGTNVVILRIGIVLGSKGGILHKMTPLFKMFLGGPLGDGNQWMSWVSIRDVIELIKFSIENDNVTGVMNITSPNPVTNKEFATTLGKVLNRPSLLQVPSLVLRLFFGESADLFLSGQKVLPKRALGYGYKFKYSNLEDALRRVLT